MSQSRQHLNRLGLVAAILIVVLPAGRSSRSIDPRSFTTYRFSTPPQIAQGDFDGDGQPDSAVIQKRDGGNRLSIQLSTAASPVELESAVTGVVNGDIDHDGDLDLIAATSSGELLIWLNDGHGRFTRKPVSRTGTLSSEPMMGATASQESASAIWTAISLPGALADRVDAIADRFLSSSAPAVEIADSVIPPPLRAPPNPSA